MRDGCLHATEAQVIAGGIDLPLAPRAHHVAGAVERGAEESPPAVHPLFTFSGFLFNRNRD